jgi:bifunctional polynucleotide phosphatase/kinase
VLPALAFKSFAERFEKPSKDEGFTDVKEVTFKFEGSEDERELWAKWTT